MVPFFIDLSEQACLVVGAGRVAERKIQTLLAAGAALTVIAPDATPRIRELAQDQSLDWHERTYRDGEASDYFLTVAAASDQAANERVSRDARDAGRLVNVVDVPDLSNIYASAVVQRGELQIAVSTSGACPALAKRLREEMEARFPESYGPLLSRLRRFRAGLRDAITDPAERKAILDRVARSDELARFLDGNEAPLEDLLTRCAS
jgi:precorrin-2 dehydrogenase/sirohydrochlorin ferrochelatase